MHGFAVMIYKGGLPPLMICAALRASMIYQACGLDRKKHLLAQVPFSYILSEQNAYVHTKNLGKNRE